MVLPSIDTSAKGRQYHKPFYSRQMIKGKVTGREKVVMATTEGLLVLSSLRRGVSANEDDTRGPSILVGIITTILFFFYFLLTTWIITIRLGGAYAIELPLICLSTVH